jgi:hypothetical protein
MQLVALVKQQFEAVPSGGDLFLCSLHSGLQSEWRSVLL